MVLNAFQSNYPKASDVEWEMLGDDYQVDFEIERVDYEAIFSAEGDMLKYKYEISSTELPEAVKKAITANYANYQIDDTDILVINKDLYYQVELDGKPDKHLVLNEDGSENASITYWD